MLRRGIREARKYRRAASSRNVLKMSDVLRVLLFEKKLLDVVRQIRRKASGKVHTEVSGFSVHSIVIVGVASRWYLTPSRK